jgi:DNA-binding SARP family transcriptional activator
VEVGVLGPLTLRVGATPVVIGSAKVRSLLSCLVLAGERPTSTDRLVEVLWGLDPPRTASHSVQVHVSKLRRLVRVAGGDLPLTSSPAGYRLSGPQLLVDARMFADELADGRAALVGGDVVAAADRLEQARSRWRGAAYPDLSDDAVVDPEAVAERTRLATLRLDADEEWAEASLGLGRHQELVPVLELAVAAEPLRERRYQ